VPSRGKELRRCGHDVILFQHGLWRIGTASRAIIAFHSRHRL
jgi:hypothetical protein